MKTYKEQLNVYKGIKDEFNSLGGCRAWFLASEQLPKDWAAILRNSKKDSELYERMKKQVRTTKKGNYVPFYLFQWINKELNGRNDK